jgi:hypothetical protein
MNAEHLRDVAQRQRHHRPVTLIHKAVLYQDDLGGNTQDGLISLLEAADKPLGFT